MFQYLYYPVVGFTSVLLVVFLAFFVYSQIQYLYWRKRNIPYMKPSFPFGSFSGVVFTKSFAEIIKNLYDEHRTDRIVGIWQFSRPSLMINDPELIKQVFVRDFLSFHDRGIYVDEEVDPLSGHLFSLSGSAWRNLRVKMTPTFTSGKMKLMFGTMVETGEQLKSYMKTPAGNRETIEIKDILARFTTDVIASCAFGLQTNSLQNPDCEFRKMGKRAIEAPILEAFLGILAFFLPEVSKFFKIKATPNDVEKFFLKAVRETIEYREKNDIKRNDFMQLMIQLKNKGYVEDADVTSKAEDENLNKHDSHKFTVNQAAAQAFVFFVAGFETSSITMQFALYELALNPDIQEKTRENIRKILSKYDGKVTYEGVQEMDYLDKVVSETLRKYPPVPFLTRECTKDCLLDDTDLLIKKGMTVQIPVFGLHRDPVHFPQPERFDPERFSEEEKSKRHHYSYLPFGEGPRVCIGNRFGLMQSKVGLISLLTCYKFEVSDKTPIPVQYDPINFLMSPLGGMHLRVVPV